MYLSEVCGISPSLLEALFLSWSCWDSVSSMLAASSIRLSGRPSATPGECCTIATRLCRCFNFSFASFNFLLKKVFLLFFFMIYYFFVLSFTSITFFTDDGALKCVSARITSYPFLMSKKKKRILILFSKQSDIFLPDFFLYLGVISPGSKTGELRLRVSWGTVVLIRIILIYWLHRNVYLLSSITLLWTKTIVKQENNRNWWALTVGTGTNDSLL